MQVAAGSQRAHASMIISSRELGPAALAPALLAGPGAPAVVPS
jgi:hypothetical protein